jgi:hypothetical protein
MLSLARPDVTVSSDALDANPWLLTVENGTLDLRTAKLREHRPEDLITKLAPVEYHSGAPAPRFEQFFRKTLISDDLIGFVRRMVGFSPGPSRNGYLQSFGAPARTARARLWSTYRTREEPVFIIHSRSRKALIGRRLGRP